ARPARRERLLSRLLEPVPLAALPPAARAHPPACTPLGALPEGQPELCRRGAGRGARACGRGLVPRLPPRAGAAVRARPAAGPLPRALLAHPVAAPRDLPGRAAGRRPGRRTPRQRSARVPAPLVRPQLPALRRRDPRR